MVAAAVRSFAGLMPRIFPELLPDAAAQVAINARLTSGALEPWKAPLHMLTLANIAPVVSLYRFGQSTTSETQFWFEFTGDTNVVRGPVAGDTQERTYWTDGVYPKKTDSTIGTTAPPYPSNAFRLAVPPPGVSPAPAYTPVASVTGTPSSPTDPATTSVYVVTYVTGWGEESAPSASSNLVTWQPGQAVSVTLPATISGNYNIAKVRLYRSNSGSSRTSFQFVTEANVGTASYSDSKTGAQLGEVLSTWDWLPAPDNLIGLCEFNSETLAGFFGNTVAFCEPGVPYAWPVKYQQAFSAPVVGIGAFGPHLFVGTTRGCHLITGSDPGGVSVEPVPTAPSCVSKRSVVPMMDGVVWASPDGLFYVGRGGVQNLTEDILTREEWQAYVPSSISGYEIDGRYYATYSTGTATGTLIFTFGKNASFVESTEYFTAGFQDKQRDSLYIVQTGNALRKWDAGAALTLTWRSKEFRYPMSVAMSSGRVDAASYPVTFRLYADGVQRGSDTLVTNGLPFRLPPGKAHTYSFRVVGTSKVTSAAIATSAKELGGV